MGQLAKALNERPRDVLPSNTVPNPREEVKVITTRSGITLARPSVSPPNPSSSSSSSKEIEQDPEMTMEQMFKKLHFNISFAEALAQMPKYAKMLKDLLTNKEKLLELLEECMALADLELANRSVAYPAGIAEDVFVQVGRPFLRTARVLVDVHGEELTLRVEDVKLTFNAESPSKCPQKHGNDNIDNGIYDLEGDIIFLEKLLKDEPPDAKKFKINPLVREPSDTLLGNKEIKFNPLKEINDPVLIPKDSMKPMDFCDPILKLSI
uniref:Reverse transcriptase domain-containing protein n=1 Tax=Tanacetum cinerariifolium TaxID=118510 RepID=A0A6L2P6U9_TANCI|nr:hypothetical protein [Tanacetum cinerariifolium]